MPGLSRNIRRSPWTTRVIVRILKISSVIFREW